MTPQNSREIAEKIVAKLHDERFFPSFWTDGFTEVIAAELEAGLERERKLEKERDAWKTERDHYHEQAFKANELIRELRRGLNNQERVLEASNELFRGAVRPVLDLWDEAERPPGVMMICAKLDSTRSERDQLAKDKERLVGACKQGLKISGYRSDVKLHDQVEEFKSTLAALLTELEEGKRK